MAQSAAMPRQKTTEGSTARRRAVRVHGLGDAMLACSVAHELDAAITLFSAPGAVATIGPAWFRSMIQELERTFPDLDMEAVLDCGDLAGYALAALRSDVRLISYSGNASAARKIKDIAGTYGGRLVRRPSRILDIRDEDDADAALRKWLGDN
jgi:hypothetical protein